MNKLDKKMIISFLIFALILITFNPIIVHGAGDENLNINSNPKLENSELTVDIINNRVLLSNGTLWDLHSDYTAEYKDNKVKSIGYIYKKTGKEISVII